MKKQWGMGHAGRASARSARRPIAMVLTIALTAAALALLPVAAAQAGVVQWGTAGGTAPSYQTTVNGDFIMAGNGVLACSGVYLPGTAGTANTCDNLHSTSTNAQNVNDNFAMINSNTVADFTSNSSTANVTIPAGATVAKAFLNWGANTGLYTGDTRTLCTAFSAQRGTATLPAGAADAYLTQAVQLKVGTAAVASIPVGSALVDPATQTTARYYSAGADVTTAFAGVSTGVAVAISAGNIWAPNGAGCFAGWSLTLIYDYGTLIAGNAFSEPHKVIYYEGQVRQGSADPALTVNFNNFTAIGAGTRAGFTLFEGDRQIVGDTFSYSRNASPTFTEIASSAGATGNFGIGRALGSVRYTQTANATAFTNQSVDVTTSTLANVVTGDTSVDLRVATAGDSYMLRNAILSVPVPGLKVVKTFNGTADTQSRTGTEVATFTITVTNVGAGTLQNISIVDDQANCTRNLPAGTTLTPLQSFTYTCVANGVTTASYTSTATATASTVSGGFLANGTDSTSVLFTAIGLTKTSALAPGAAGVAGDVLTYTFVVTNTGASALTGVSVTDPLPGLSALTFTWPAAVGALTPGQSATATATYTLTQANVDAGSVANTASTVGTDNDGGVQPVAQASRTTPIVSAPALAVTKSGAYTGGGTGIVGDVIQYSFTVKNTGNVTLTNTTLVDPLPGLSPPVITWPTATAGTLAPGATATATATYTITQANVDAGSVNNTATANGKPPTGANVSASSPATTVPTAASAPAITTTKSASVAGTGAVGNVITYTFVTKNIGNVTLTGVAVSDPLVGLSAVASGPWPGATVGTLAPGQSVSSSATYTITQADVDAGSVKNTATSAGKPPTGANVSGASPLVTTPTAAAAPAITLTKSGALASGSTVGSLVNYSFSLKNTGNVTLTGVTITDPLVGLSALAFVWPGTPGTLLPGQTVTATATYALKQSDIDSGSVANTASGIGKPPTGANVTRITPATVALTQAPAVTISKSGAINSPGTGVVGNTITYTFTVKNTGNVTLTAVAVSDPLPGLSALTFTWPGVAGTLTPNQTATATATRVITQADVDAGSVKNTASVSAKPPTGANITASSAQVTVATIAPAPAITTGKSAVRGGTGAVGDVISYSFVTTNTGNVTLTGVTVTDPLPGLSAITNGPWPSGTVGTLAPGQSVTSTATYSITQSNVNTGSVTNTATSTGKPPTGANVAGTSPAIVTPTASAAPAVTATKSGTLAPGATGVAGDTVNYSFSLKNTGNVTLTAVSLADPLPGLSALTYTWPATVGTLNPGQTVTATATYLLTQSDVNAGSVANTVTGTGTPPTGANTTGTAAATVPVSASPTLLTTKSGAINSPGTGVAGNVITYTFSTRNTGNVTLTSVAINDPLPGLSARTYSWPGAAGTLTPGQTATATATYTITQADVDAGSVRNTATATGLTSGGATVVGPSPQVIVPMAVSAPALATTKSAAVAGTGAVGNVITYSFLAKNTGNVTLTGVSIADPLSGLSALAYTWPGTVGTLAPGQTATATATYTITQADVDAKSIKNTATSTGSAPNGATTTGVSPQVTTPTIVSAPATTLTKSGSFSTVAPRAVGDVITYSFTLKNTGNVTLTSAAITDPLPGLSALTYTWPGTAGTLAPGQTVVAVATYAITQADLDAGSVANTARSTANPPTGAAITRTTPATVPIATSSSIAVTKSGSIVTPGTGIAGDIIQYSFTITNTGSVTLSGVTLTDSKPGISAPVISWPAAAGVLAPGQIASATASYTLTQADVDSGSVANVATAAGTPPSGPRVSAVSGQSIVPTAPAAPALLTGKTGAIAPGEPGEAGDTVQYTFTARNTGNVTLTGVTISDPKPGLSVISYGPWPGATGTLAPGQFVTATAVYLLTQADVNSGSTSNAATSSGTTPAGALVTSPSPTVVVATAASTPTISLDKSGALAAGSTGAAADLANYSFSVTNTGIVTLTSVTITDPLPGLSTLVYSWPGTAGTLQPGQTATATATYSLSQADVDAGSLANTATVNATGPTGAAVSATDPATIPIAAASTLVVTKGGTIRSPGSGVAGDIIDYTFAVRNSGTVTLTAVTITDPKPGLSPLTVTWPGTPGSLAPGQSATATASYTIIQADVDTGTVRNTASANATTPAGAATGASSPELVIPMAAPVSTLTTTKTGTSAGTGAVGDTVTFAMSTRNSGNVTLTGVAITDTLVGLSALVYVWPGAVGVLAPGQTVTATATYTITQADVDAGSVRNTATATGTTPSGSTTAGPSPLASVPTVPANPSITVNKTAIPRGTGTAGDQINYSFTLTNTGNVTLGGVALTDSLLNLPAPVVSWPGTPGILAPGQTATATASYSVRQTDVDAGAVANVVSVSGNPPTGAPATATDSATVPLTAAPLLEVTKSGAVVAPGTGLAGDVIQYSFTITNAGNVTVSTITLSDSRPGVSTPVISWPAVAGVLAPSEVATATATYTITQADVDAGVVDNTATADGRAPSGAPVSDASPVSSVSTAAAAPVIVTGKSGAIRAPGTGAVGDVVDYIFRATNTGNVTLTGVTISDPLPGLSSIAFGPWPGTPGTLSPGQFVSATATYTITQANVDAGSVTNVASSAGLPPSGTAVSAPSDLVVVPTVAAAGQVVLDKVATPAGGFTGVAGNTIGYTFTLTNPGNVTVTGVTLTDPLPGLSAPVIVWPGTPGTLAPGQIATATATYQLTQADVDAGSVANTATMNGSGPFATALTATDSATVAIASNPGLVLTKDGAVAAPGLGDVGDTVLYTFGVTNTGNVTVSGVTIADPLPGLSVITIAWPGTPGILLPGQSATATASYVITQADVDNQVITNTASATGTTPNGTNLTAVSPQVVVPTITAGPSIKVDKTGAAQGSGNLGDTIIFTLIVTNTGNVTLTSVDVSDDLSGISAVTFGSWPGTTGELNPGEFATATATYVITQADVDAGVVRNTATAKGADPAGNGVVDQSLIAEVPTVASAPAIAVTHGGSLALGGTGIAGDTVDWTYSLTNTGNVTLTGVQLTDLLPGVSGITYVWPGVPGVLTPGQTVTAVATYLLTQSDVDAGAVSSTVVGSGTPPRGTDVTASAPATVAIGQVPSILVTKSGALVGPGLPGDTITYSFAIQNTGTVTLTAVDLTDSLVGLSVPVISWPGVSGQLAPNAIATATATYIVTQADVDRGFVDNIASTTGRTPPGSTVTDDSPIARVPLAAPTPALVTTKSGAAAGSGSVGDVITWSFTISNAGNVTLTAVSLVDTLAGLSIPVINWPGAIGSLAPGATATATATSVITQAEVDAGSVQNVATSSGQAPNGALVSDPSDLAVVPTVAPVANGALTKAGVLAAGSTGAAGDLVEYTLSYRNTGNVTVTDVTLTDPLPGLSALLLSWPGAIGTLEPGQTVTATATYVVTQADVDSGSIANLATASATPAQGARFDRATAATVPLVSGPSIELSKTGMITPGDTGVAGDTIDFSFVITNTGNVTLSAVTVVDALPGISSPVVVWPGSPSVLAPGESATATATYTITQADVDAGAVSNSATTDGTSPTGSVVTAEATALVATAAPLPRVVTTKTASLAGAGAVGDTVTYTIKSRNTGNVTLTGVTISDPLPRLSALTTVWPGVAGTLAPGQTATSTATYVLDQADIDAGQVVNTAASSGTSPTGVVASDPSEQTIVTTESRTPRVSVTHDGALAGGSTGVAGDTVEWSYTLTNTGNVTLSGVTLTDPQPGQTALVYVWPGTPGVLLPGQTVTATSQYVLAQADVDAGSVTTTVTGSGTPPSGANATATDPATVAIAPRASMVGTKVGTIRGGGIGAAGDVIDYSFSVANTGNVTLTLVDIADSLGGVSNLVFVWPNVPGILAPGLTATATANYTITQADFDSGAVVNIATITGKPPTGQNIEISTPASTLAIGVPVPAILTTKSAVVGGSGAVGDTITYTLTSQNTGNVTLGGVTISDPLAGLSPIAYGPWPGATVGGLAPGQSVSATATYLVTQADVDRGRVDNVASSSGTAPSSAVITDPSDVVSAALVTAAPELTVAKSGAIFSTGAVGDIITWTLTLTNSGNVTLTGASMTDSLPGISALTYGAWPNGATGVLRPGQSVTATATSTITQADVDASTVRNTATATAASPSGASIAAASPEAVVPTVSADAVISIEKQQVLSPGSTGRAGDVVQHSYQITNTGNQTLTGVTLTDPQAGLGPFTFSWPGTPGVLLPGQSVTVTATHVLTQAEVDAGGVGSAGTATALTPLSTIVSDVAAANVAIPPTPTVTFQKTALFDTVAQVGASIVYGFTLTNTGNVTLSGVAITDSLPGISAIAYTWPGVVGVLAPGDVLTATASYTITQADVDAGAVINAASARMTAPSGAAVSATDSVSQAIANDPDVELTASVSLRLGQAGYPGDVLDYSYVATNTGNTTLTGVQIIDPRTGLSVLNYAWPGAPGVLLPGQSVTATAFYVITADDAGKQLVSNARVVSVNEPDGSAVLDSAIVAITLPTLAIVPTPRGPGLPNTGSDPSAGLAAALALLVSGLMLIVVGRVRRRKVSD